MHRTASQSAARHHGKRLFSPRPIVAAVHLAMAGGLIASAAWSPEVQAQQAATRSYNIAAGPLSSVLTQYAGETGIFIAGASEMAQGKQSPGVKGSHTAQSGLAALLAGTGLMAVLREDGRYELRPAPVVSRSGDVQLAPVVVTAGSEMGGSAEAAYRVKSASVGALGEKSLKDTPYSIEVYSRELMENKQARSLSDLTKADASISPMVGNIVTENLALAIRGVRPDFDTGQKIDGLNAWVDAKDLPLEHLERVEILKGAGGFLYGFGTPGGIVNYVLKRPTDEPVRSLSTQIMDSGLALIHGDLGGRFGADKAFGYRINLVSEEGDTYINDGKSRRHSGSLALDWRITPDFVWRVDALLSEHVRKGGYWGVVPNADGAVNNWATSEPLAPIDGGKRLAPSFSRVATQHETYGTDAVWKFASEWSLTVAHRYTDNGREWGQPIIFSSAAGDYSLNLFNTAGRYKNQHSQGHIRGTFTTGAIAHDLTLGLSYSKTRNFSVSGSTIPLSNAGNLSDPIEIANPFASFLSYKDADNEYARTRRKELFVSDTIHLGKNLDVIVGLRRGNLKSEFSNYDKSETTPTLAAVFRPMQGLSLYGSYVEALEEGATAPATAANSNEVFPPLVSKQYEVGAKAEGRDWAASAALFRLQRGLTYTTPDNVFTQDGEARYEGLEFSGKFRLSPQWLVTASAMWLDATNQKTTGGTLDGKRIQGVAREQASIYGEYRVAGLPLTLTAGARYVGKRPVDTHNQWNVGSFTLLDVGARYETKWGSSPVILRLNVDNLNDKAYWITREAGNHLQQGAPRTVKLGAQIEF